MRDGLGGEGMQVDARILPQRLGGWQKVELHAQAGDRREHLRRGQHHAASQFGGFHAGQIQGGALAGDGCVGRLSVYLHATHAQPLARGMDFDLLLLADGPRDQRSGDHRSEAFHGEDAINGQAEDGGGILRWNFGSQACEFGLQPVKTQCRSSSSRE